MPDSINETADTKAANQTPNSAYVGNKAAITCILLVVAATAFGAFIKTLDTGFLLDDFAHIESAAKAVHGDWSDLYRAFTGNWTGATDNLTSYRPFISLSFCLDYLFWQTNSFGYHCTNLLMFAGCSVLTSRLMLELSAPFKNYKLSLLMALISGMLFALYPLHPEAVAWIIGRVDVQCALFYYASLYTFLVFRRTGAQWLLILSLISFACALPSKEMAVTLPAVIILAELLLPADSMGWKKINLKNRITLMSSYCLLLAVFAVIRTSALGTIVGGYGGGGFKEFLKSLKNFRDADTWTKVFYGINEEIPMALAFAPIAKYLVWTLGALASLRLFEKLSYWRTVAFLVLWACVSELPTFQIWHVYPNLCGSRLLFLPSAPFCMVLVMLAIPPFELLANKVKNKMLSTVPQIVGGILLSGLGILWCNALATNLIPWANAGNQMKTLTEQVRHFASETPEGKVTLLLDLPQDISGAGLLGRPEFLAKILSPPLDQVNEIDKLHSAESPIAGAHDYASPHNVERLLSNPAIIGTYKWNRAEGRYFGWTHPTGESQFDTRLNDIGSSSSSSGSSVAGSKVSNDSINWLAPTHLDPFKVQIIELFTQDNSKLEDIAGKIQLVWRSKNQEKSWIDYSEGPSGMFVNGRIIFVPSRYRSWLYQGEITQIGLKISPGTKVNVTEVKGGSDMDLMPQVKAVIKPKGVSVVANAVTKTGPAETGASKTGAAKTGAAKTGAAKTGAAKTGATETSATSTASELTPLEQSIDSATKPLAPTEISAATIYPGDHVEVQFDCSTIPGAKRSLIELSNSGYARYDTANAISLPQNQRLFQTIINKTQGTLILPEALTQKPGVHQISVLAVDDEDKPLGLFSEPISLRVKTSASQPKADVSK